MPLSAHLHAYPHRLPENASNSVHPLRGLRLQRLGYLALSRGQLHFHGQPPLFSPNSDASFQSPTEELRILSHPFSVVSARLSVFSSPELMSLKSCVAP